LGESKIFGPFSLHVQTRESKNFNASRDTDVPLCAGMRVVRLARSTGLSPHAHARTTIGSGSGRGPYAPMPLAPGRAPNSHQPAAHARGYASAVDICMAGRSGFSTAAPMALPMRSRSQPEAERNAEGQPQPAEPPTSPAARASLRSVARWPWQSPLNHG